MEQEERRRALKFAEKQKLIEFVLRREEEEQEALKAKKARIVAEYPARLRIREEMILREEREIEARKLREDLSTAVKATSKPPLQSQPKPVAFPNVVRLDRLVREEMRKGWPIDTKKLTRKFLGNESPEVKPRPIPFRKARLQPRFIDVLRQEMGDFERRYKSKEEDFRTVVRQRRRPSRFMGKVRDVRVNDNTTAFRQDFAPQVEKDLDDATFLTHQDWEQRIDEVASRRKEQEQEVQPEEAHSTGIIDTLKNWATGLWKKVKETFWG